MMPRFFFLFLALLAVPPAFAEDAKPDAGNKAAAEAAVAPVLPEAQADRFKVEADFSKKLGDASVIKNFFGSGGGLYYISNNVDDPVMQSWRDLGFNLITFETLHLEAPDERWIEVEVDEKGRVQIDFTDYDRYMRAYLKGLGAQPFVYLGNVPRALSSKPQDPDYSIYRPKDLKLWRQFIQKMVEHNVKKFKLKGAYYGVLGEPDHPDSWRGSGSGDPKKTLREHIELYAATYRAVKAADKTAKVGGPATMSWKETKQGGHPPFVLKDWIRALADYNKEDKAQAVGLDYISWQDYGWTGERIQAGAEAVSGFLKDAGFDPATPKLLAGSGWGSWSSDYLNGSITPFQRASSIMDNLIAEFKNPEARRFERGLYYSFYFNDYWITPGNEKDMKQQRSVALVIIPKEGRYQLTPAYASFQMLKAMTTGQIVEASAQKPLQAMAVLDEAGRRAIVTVNNHTPDMRIIDFDIKEIPLNLDEVKAHLQSIDEFHSVDGYGLEDGSIIEPVITGKNAVVSIFIKPYGSLQITWRKPDPPKPVESPEAAAQEQQADDDIRPR